MFTFYKFYLSKVSKMWEIHFLKDNERTIIKTRSALERFLSNVNYLVGFDNYRVCDKLLASILRDTEPLETLLKINDNKRVSFRINNPITIDVKQGLSSIDTIEEVKLNLNKNDDLDVIEHIFKQREDYFSSKFEIVKEFNLQPGSLRKTILNLSSDILKTRKGTDKDRVIINYDKRLELEELPKPVRTFYEDIETKYKKTNDFRIAERERFTFKLAGLEHVYGLGGLHAAKSKYVAEGNFMMIDFKGFYPSLIINNKFMDKEPLKTYEMLYNKRNALQLEKDSKEEAYKLITNIVYGGLKSTWSNLYNPRMANNVVVNGQLMITHLIQLLENFSELIQTNTDGIIIKYDKVMKEPINKIIKLFEIQYKLTLDVLYINKIVQRDVNNYAIRFMNGEVVGKGVYNSHQFNDFERNSLKIIPISLINYYMNGVKTNKTIINEWQQGNLELFQNIVKSGNYDGMAHEKKDNTLFEGNYTTRYEKIKNTNRVFATNDKLAGGVYLTKEGKQTKYTKVPYTSENSLVWNGDIKELNRRKIALNWYIQQTNRLLF